MLKGKRLEKSSLRNTSFVLVLVLFACEETAALDDAAWAAIADTFDKPSTYTGEYSVREIRIHRGSLHRCEDLVFDYLSEPIRVMTRDHGDAPSKRNTIVHIREPRKRGNRYYFRYAERTEEKKWGQEEDRFAGVRKMCVKDGQWRVQDGEGCADCPLSPDEVEGIRKFCASSKPEDWEPRIPFRYRVERFLNDFVFHTCR
jgi:hypothetical protein